MTPTGLAPTHQAAFERLVAGKHLFIEFIEGSDGPGEVTWAFPARAACTGPGDLPMRRPANMKARDRTPERDVRLRRHQRSRRSLHRRLPDDIHLERLDARPRPPNPGFMTAGSGSAG